jgi:hypothetical protein
LLVVEALEHIRVRVLDIEQRRAVERGPIHHAVGDDQLGGLGDHNDVGRAGLERRRGTRGLVGRSGHQVDRAGFSEVGRDLCDGGRNAGRNRPRTRKSGRLQEAVEQMKIHRTRTVTHQQRPRIEHALQRRAGDGPPCRVAVDCHQHGRRGREHELRNGILHRHRLRPLFRAGHDERGLHPVERDGERPLDEERLDRLLVACRPIRGRRKIRALHRGVAKVDGPRDTVDLRLRRDRDDAEHGALLARRQHRNRRVSGKAGVVPTVELRLEHRIDGTVELRGLRLPVDAGRCGRRLRCWGGGLRQRHGTSEGDACRHRCRNDPLRHVRSPRKPAANLLASLTRQRSRVAVH